MAGPYGVRDFTRTLEASGGAIYLAVPQLVSVDTVTTEAGQGVTVDVIDTRSGIIVTATASSGWWTVTGTHGHESGEEPPAMVEATLALARHWWGPRAGLREAQRTDASGTAILGGYGWPRAVRELLASIPTAVHGLY